MQIDFHHGVTYVVARLAGMSHKDADVLSYSAQYVDDNIHTGAIQFSNGGRYYRESSAHKMIDYRNLKALANLKCWVPFHFLPGNGNLPQGDNPEGSFIRKLICRPNSKVAQDMVTLAIENKHKPYGLHRFGITMHVYIDTWAHQGFAGISHAHNEVSEISIDGKNCEEVLKRLKGRWRDRLKSWFVERMSALGHGPVLSYPDRPYLNWTYKDSNGAVVVRNNPEDFMQAAEHMCIAIQRFIKGDSSADVPGFTGADQKDVALLESMISSITDTNGEARHKKWLQAVNIGAFNFGAESLEYRPKGMGSWKHKALNTCLHKDTGKEIYDYTLAFECSDWKLFHDGILSHRFDVLHEILPRYGIRVA